MFYLQVITLILLFISVLLSFNSYFLEKKKRKIINSIRSDLDILSKSIQELRIDIDKNKEPVSNLYKMISSVQDSTSAMLDFIKK